MSKPDGGRAFPSSYADSVYAGMTLRDYFATHAPAMPNWWFDSSKYHHSNALRLDAEAAWRYEYADTMLIAREDDEC